MTSSCSLTRLRVGAGVGVTPATRTPIPTFPRKRVKGRRDAS